MNTGVVVSADGLTAFAASVLHAQGLEAQRAAEVAQVLVWADLRGVGSHGVSRLPLYLQWLRSGEMNANAILSEAKCASALAVLDGDGSPGAVAMRRAAVSACRMAKDAGVGAVLVRHTTHTGALGYYTESMAAQGVVGLAMAASGPHMVYHGASVPAVSTAPLSIAVPRGGGANPIVLDMSSAAIAMGKIVQARRTGTPLPPDSAVDREGHATQDPAAAVAPLPLGGPKGSGLALMIELICSAFTGAGILAEALSAPDTRHPHRQNAMVLGLDLGRISPSGGASTEIDKLLEQLKLLTTSTGTEVMLPGERGYVEAHKRALAGIPLSASLADKLADCAIALGLPAPWRTRVN